MNIRQVIVLIGALLAMSPLLSASAPSEAAPSTNVSVQRVAVVVNRPFRLEIDDHEGCNRVENYDQVSLLINGIDISLHPLGCDPVNRMLAFNLVKDLSQQSVAVDRRWQAILGRPWSSAKSRFVRELDYSVVRKDSSGTGVLGSGKLELRMLSPGWAFAGSAMVLGVWVALVFLGRRSGMLRDAGNPGTTLRERPYSLGRAQMAWWFGIVIGAYVFLWVMTGDTPMLSEQALALIGVSSVTGLVSAGIDAGKKTVFPVSSGSFLLDLLTDADGVTLYRFQMLAMTVILGIIFLFHVAITLTMPEFDSATLALMGIGAGTYVGFKFPEQHVTSAAESQAANAADDHKAGYTPEPATPGN